MENGDEDEDEEKVVFHRFHLMCNSVFDAIFTKLIALITTIESRAPFSSQSEICVDTLPEREREMKTCSRKVFGLNLTQLNDNFQQDIYMKVLMNAACICATVGLLSHVCIYKSAPAESEWMNE